MAEHKIKSIDEPVRGYPGTVARCTCGFKSSWGVQDGSAERDGADHLRRFATPEPSPTGAFEDAEIAREEANDPRTRAGNEYRNSPRFERRPYMERMNHESHFLSGWDAAAKHFESHIEAAKDAVYAHKDAADGNLDTILEALTEGQSPASTTAADAIAREALAIRNAFTEFWGAHSSRDLEAVGVSPGMPETPALDAHSRAQAKEASDGE